MEKGNRLSLAIKNGLNDSNPEDIIKTGGVLVFPTETVYGLGADATNDDAVQKIFSLKGRPANNPLITHCYDIKQAEEFVEMNSIARLITKNFCPGPLSLVLPLKRYGKDSIARSVTAGLNTICIRIPSNAIALNLIKKSNTPIAAPSANKSNYISATKYEHIRTEFPNIPVIDGGSSTYGIESTIIDLTSDIPVILRHGFISQSAIENILNKKILSSSNTNLEIKSPGMLKKHYSPHTKIKINITSSSNEDVVLKFGDSTLAGAYVLNLSERGDLIEAAKNLYSMLRELDDYCIKNDIKTILIDKIPQRGIGIAINDKLNRAIGR